MITFKTMRLVLLLAFVLVGLAVVPSATAAPAQHPAPTVIHDYIVSLTPRALTIESYLRISPELVPEVYRQIDTDNDGKTSDAEREGWVRTHAAALSVSLDGVPVQLKMSAVPDLSREALLLSVGRPLLVTYRTEFEDPIEAKHRIQLKYGDSYLPYDEYYISVAGDRMGDTKPRNVTRPQYPATYQIVYQIPAGVGATTAAQGQLAPAPYNGDAQPGAASQTAGAVATPAQAGQPIPASTAALPTPAVADLPVPQPQAALPTQSIAGQAPALAPIAGTAGQSGGGRALRVLEMLRNWHGEPASALVMLLLALGIGALHALTPGHGKAVVAAYLIGSRGRVRDAALLGAVVTITHTFGVVLLGVVLLLVSNFSMPRALQPGLELLSGALVVVLGVYLLIQRWRQLRAAPGVDSSNTMHTHDHDFSHGVDGQAHSHGGRVHSHAPVSGSASPRALVGLGISGGLVPCPDALAILLLAVGVGQIGLGLGLVASFSIGLAGVLIAIGVTLVKVKGALQRSRAAGFSSSLWMRWVPLASAVVVVVVGILMVTASLGKAWS